LLLFRDGKAGYGKAGGFMKCPDCGYDDSRVIDSRPTENKIRRRRECLKCSERFTTYEIIEDMPVMVVKKDNTIEPFDSQKLIDRVLRATIKRPVKLKTVESMVENIQTDFKNRLQREVSSEKIGEIVLRKLKDIDHVAYVRFASVYREFDDVESFIKIISELSSELEKTP
jgi:transcriptional repressor NrdR